MSLLVGLFDCRVMDALQVLMSELGRTDVKSLSIAQADIQAMEKIASTGGLGVGGRGGGGTGGAKCKGNNSGYNHSGASPSPSAGKLDFKNSASPYSSGASSERGYGSATRSYHSTPVSVDKWSSNSSGNGIYSSDSKSPDSPFYSDYKRTIGLPPSGSSSNVTNSGSNTNHTDHYSTSSSGYSNPVNISEITGVSSTGDSILPDEDECGASRGPSRSGSTTSSQLVITTALNTQANSSLALPLEIMNTNFISPKHATNVMVNVPDKVPGQAMATAVLPSKGILFATPLTEERSVSSREHAVGSSSVPEAVAPIRAADAATSVDASSAVQRFESPTITTGPSTNSSASNSLGTSTISSPIEIEIPRGRTRSEQEELQGESKANSVVPSPRDEEGQRGQRPLQPQQPLASGRSGRARK